MATKFDSIAYQAKELRYKAQIAELNQEIEKLNHELADARDQLTKQASELSYLRGYVKGIESTLCINSDEDLLK